MWPRLRLTIETNRPIKPKHPRYGNSIQHPLSSSHMYVYWRVLLYAVKDVHARVSKHRLAQLSNLQCKPNIISLQQICRAALRSLLKRRCKCEVWARSDDNALIHLNHHLVDRYLLNCHRKRFPSKCKYMAAMPHTPVHHLRCIFPRPNSPRSPPCFALEQSLSLRAMSSNPAFLLTISSRNSVVG